MRISTDKQLELLNELKERLNAFSVVRDLSIWLFVVLLLIVGAILAIALEEILFMILVIVGGCLIGFIGLKIVDTTPHRKDIAYEICSLMDECLAESHEKNRKIGSTIISTVSIYGNNRALYKRFVAQFPVMKSFKLWYICGYKGSV